MNDSTRVLVQVVPVEQGGEIGSGPNITNRLEERLQDLRDGLAAGARAIADSLGTLPAAEDWQVGDVSAKFGVTLTAQAGVILSKSSSPR